MFVGIYDWLLLNVCQNGLLADYISQVDGGGLLPGVTGWLWLITCGLLALSFYCLLDNSAGKRFRRWMGWWAAAVVLNFAHAFFFVWYFLGRNNVILNVLEEEMSGYEPVYAGFVDMFTFGSANALLAFILFFLLSAFTKTISTNNCFVPFKFPEK